MATIYRKKYPVPMPEGAEIITRRGQRLARWTDGYGRVKTAPLAADGRQIMHEAGCWYARYRGADGVTRRASTNCCDERAARQVLANLLAKVEKIKSGILTTAETKAGDNACQAMAEHLEDYLQHLGIKRLRGRKVSEQYRKNIRGRLKRLIAECGFRRLADVTRTSIERWLASAEDTGMTAATRNEYLTSIHAFCNWAVRDGRLLGNPLAGVQKADRSEDRRRQRRAMTEEEVARLLRATALRPVAELGRKTRKLQPEDRTGRSTWTYEPLTAENLDECHERGLLRLQERPCDIGKLERLGRERALFYRMAVLTGLRRNELASLTVGHLHLEAVPSAFVELLAKDAKNAKQALLPLRQDLVAEIGAYLDEQLEGLQRAAPDALPDELPLNMPLFKSVPTIRVFDADIAAAGLPKADRRGHTLDIHALRHTFGTHLSLAGVLPRTAQAAMRHSRIDLTMNVYTDPVLLDVAGAVNALPGFGQAAITAKPATATAAS